MKKIILIIILLIVLSFSACSKSPEEAYKNAEEINTIESYQLVIKNYPKSEFEPKAKRNIAKIIFYQYIAKAKEKAKLLEKSSYDDCRRLVRKRGKMFKHWFSDSDYDFYIISFNPTAHGQLLMANENTFYFRVTPWAKSKCKGERYGKVEEGGGISYKSETYLLSFEDSKPVIVEKDHDDWAKTVEALGGPWVDWIIEKVE